MQSNHVTANTNHIKELRILLTSPENVIKYKLIWVSSVVKHSQGLNMLRLCHIAFTPIMMKHKWAIFYIILPLCSEEDITLRVSPVVPQGVLCYELRQTVE